MNTAQLIVRGLQLTLPESLERYVERGLDTTCCITGSRITEGIAWYRVIPASTGEYLDLMHGMTFEYMSLDAAAAFKGSWNMGSRLIFEDGTAYHPYIASSSADANERTYWSALVREVWPGRAGQQCLCIVAGDFKKKVWPRARVGPLGSDTPVYVLDPDRFVSQNLTVNWERLIAMLDLMETIYTAGFSKAAIADGLYLHYAAFGIDPVRAIGWEAELQSVRGRPEFTMAILIAQRKE